MLSFIACAKSEKVNPAALNKRTTQAMSPDTPGIAGHLVQIGKAMTVLLPPVNDAGVHVSNWQRKTIIQLIARKIIVALGWCNITNKFCSQQRGQTFTCIFSCRWSWLVNHCSIRFPFKVPLLSDIVNCSIPLLIAQDTEIFEPWVQQRRNGVHLKNVCRQRSNEMILKCITERRTRENIFTSHICRRKHHCLIPWSNNIRLSCFLDEHVR